MEEIKLSPEEIKKAIDFGKLIGSGFFSRVFTYKGRLIKMDKELYNLIKVNDPRVIRRTIADHYRWQKEDFDDREQIEELSKRQPFIRPRVPEGIITLKGVDSSIDGISPGIIIPHFKGYESIAKVPKDDYRRLLILLKQVLDDIKNLADNQISQADISAHRNDSDFNILQKGNDAQLIDMTGPFVTVGSKFTTPLEMYKDFAQVLNYYYRQKGIPPIHKADDDMTEEKLAEMITELDKQTRK